MTKLGVALFYVFSFLCLMSVISLVESRFSTGRYLPVDFVLSIYFLVSAMVFMIFRIDKFLGLSFLSFTLSVPFFLIWLKSVVSENIDYVGVFLWITFHDFCVGFCKKSRDKLVVRKVFI